MIQLNTRLPTTWSAADLLEHLGGIPPHRIRIFPPPGTATEQDVTDIGASEGRLYELIDGVLVEKTMGYFESRLAMLLGHFIESFLEQHDLGIVVGLDGTVRLAPGMVRSPDVAFFSWNHFPNRQLPRESIPNLVPDLAVEVLSASNTRQEMDRKLHEYFATGVRLVWYVDPD